jgi:hypothetical protein
MLVVMLLASLVFSAYAEGQGYSRFNNPGKGNDWDWNQVPNGNNSNDNSNDQHNANGYQNHLPLEQDPGDDEN